MTLLDVRILVQGYLNENKKQIKRFRAYNLPGEEWACAFFKSQPELSVRFSENIKRVCANVSSKSINQYFDELEISLQNVPLSNIVNYDETCFVDDLGKQH